MPLAICGKIRVMKETLLAGSLDMGRTRTGGQGRGFTLIELLVVIAVIALLMAVLLPALRRVRNQAKSVICQSNLRQWGMVSTMYVGDNDGRMPEYW